MEHDINVCACTNERAIYDTKIVVVAIAAANELYAATMATIEYIHNRDIQLCLSLLWRASKKLEN